MGVLGGHSPDQCIAALREKVEHQDRFCQEFIWGEDCPHEYKTLDDELKKAQGVAKTWRQRAIRLRVLVARFITQAGIVVQEAKHHEGHAGIRLMQKRVFADLETISNEAVKVLKGDE